MVQSLLYPDKPNCLFTPAKMGAGKQYKKENFMNDAKNLEYVSKPCLDYNAHMWVLLYGLWKLEQLATRMNFWLPLVGCSWHVIYHFVPSSVFMGDTPAHDKLCCLCIHPKAKYICWMCNISHKFLDEPAEPYELWDMHILKGLLCNEIMNQSRKWNTICISKTYCLSSSIAILWGLNQAVPPDGLHVID